MFSSFSSFQDVNIIGCVTPAVETDWAVTIVRQDTFLLVPILLRSSLFWVFTFRECTTSTRFALSDFGFLLGCFPRLVAAVIAEEDRVCILYLSMLTVYSFVDFLPFRIYA